MKQTLILWLLNLLQASLMLLVAPLLAGIVRKFKARLQNRRGASLLQPYQDCENCSAKRACLPTTARGSSAPHRW